jgi:hypothetical protein
MATGTPPIGFQPLEDTFMDKVTEAKAKTITDYITATKKNG